MYAPTYHTPPCYHIVLRAYLELWTLNHNSHQMIGIKSNSIESETHGDESPPLRNFNRDRGFVTRLDISTNQNIHECPSTLTSSRISAIMAIGTSPLQNGRRIPRSTTPGAAPTVLQTNSDAHPNMRYSYTQTPTEFQRPVFEQFSPADSMIEESPISPREGHRANLAERAMNAHFPPAKDALPQSDSQHVLQPPREVHPAHFAPYAEPAPQPEQAHHSQVPQSPGPLPLKLHEEPTSPKVATVHTSEQERRRLGSPRLGQNTEQPTLVYSPDSLAGPNVAHEAHRPGQVSHPNAVVDPEWKHGLCEVDTLCCTGLFCPCIVYGKTQYRLSRKAQKQEPTDLLGYDACNTSCGVMAVACGLQCVYPSVTEERTVTDGHRGFCRITTKQNT